MSRFTISFILLVFGMSFIGYTLATLFAFLLGGIPWQAPLGCFIIAFLLLGSFHLLYRLEFKSWGTND